MWCRTWFDPDKRQTRRVSLGTADLQEAVVALAKFVLLNEAPTEQSRRDATLPKVWTLYYEQYARNIPSAEQARLALHYWTTFFGDADVSTLTPQNQERFIEWLRGQERRDGKPFSDGYISRILSTGRAALNRAWKRQVIAAAPFIMDVPDRAPPTERYALSPAEMARVVTGTREGPPHMRTFVMIALCTLARPDAILDLSPAQVDHTYRIIDLNPTGRRQTKKYRPVVPLVDALVPVLGEAEGERFVHWRGCPIDSIKTGWRALRDRVALPKAACPYSIRHGMARELRRRGVGEWEIAGVLGHRRPGVTERYARFAPDYLGEAARAIQAVVTEISA